MEFIHEQDCIYCQNEAGKIIAEISFPAVGPSIVNIDHTYVDRALRDQGIADQLLHAAVRDIRARGMKVTPTCSYAAAWFERHPECADILASRRAY